MFWINDLGFLKIRKIATDCKDKSIILTKVQTGRLRYLTEIKALICFSNSLFRVPHIVN